MKKKEAVGKTHCLVTLKKLTKKGGRDRMGGGCSGVAVKLRGTRWANEWAGVVFEWAERWGAR